MERGGSRGPGVPRRDERGLRRRPSPRSCWAARCATARSCPRSASRSACRCSTGTGSSPGRPGTGKTKTLQVMAGQLSRAGVPVLRGRHQGRPDRARRARRRDEPEGHRARHERSAGRSSRPAIPVEFLSLSGKLGAQVRATVHSLRAAAARQGPRPQRDPDVDPRARLQVLRRQRPAAARPDGPDDDAASSSRPTRASRSSTSTAGCRARRSASSSARSSILEQEGADVFFGEPEFDVDDLLRTTPDGAGDHQRPRAVRRHGPAAPVQHVHALDARPALPGAARGRRPAQAQAVLLLRRGAPAVRRRVGGAHGPGRADGPAHPLEGRRGLLRDPGPDRRPVVGPGPARQPGPARAAGVHARGRRRPAQDRPDVPDDRLLRRRGDDHVARDRRGAGDGPLAARRADAARGDPARCRPIR